MLKLIFSKCPSLPASNPTNQMLKLILLNVPSSLFSPHKSNIEVNFLEMSVPPSFSSEESNVQVNFLEMSLPTSFSPHESNVCWFSWNVPPSPFSPHWSNVEVGFLEMSFPPSYPTYQMLRLRLALPQVKNKKMIGREPHFNVIIIIQFPV